MIFNTRLQYTPALELHEFNEHALLIDTETVGRGAFMEVIEVALGNHAGQIVFHSLVQPVLNAKFQAVKTARFALQEFEQAKEWSSVWPELEQVISGKVLIAYNASFDRRALAGMCARLRVTSNERGWRCAMQLVKQHMNLQRSPTLDQACAHFGVAGGNHRAVGDVEATYRLLQKLK